MTDKQIIIDGVDVSGCESFCRGICCQEGFGKGASCKLFSDCLYKQLKRKEQELEQEQALKETYLACYKAKHEDIEGELFKLREYKKSKQASYEALQKRWNNVELENRKLKQTLTEIKDLLLKTPTDSPQHCINAKSVILQKISEVIDEEV